MTISLRRMQETDRPVIEKFTVQTEQTAYVEPLKETLANVEQRVNFVIDNDGIAVGFFQIDKSSGLQCVANHLELHEVSIDQSQQGKGYGKAFVAALPEFLQRGFPEQNGVCLTVNCRNHNAKRLYELGGFIDTGRLKQDGPSGPQYIMRRDLNDA